MDLSENFKNLLIEFSNYYKDTCKYDKYKENNDPVMCVYSEMLINNLLYIENGLEDNDVELYEEIKNNIFNIKNDENYNLDCCQLINSFSDQSKEFINLIIIILSDMTYIIPDSIFEKIKLKKDINIENDCDLLLLKSQFSKLFFKIYNLWNKCPKEYEDDIEKLDDLTLEFDVLFFDKYMVNRYKFLFNRIFNNNDRSIEVSINIIKDIIRHLENCILKYQDKINIPILNNKNLSQYNVKELRLLCKEKGIKIKSCDKRQDIENKIKLTF